MKNIIKIYAWQFLSLITGFATMFVVTPFLAANQSYFGVYTFVVSLGLFLSYADFGFLSAGIKFAAEAFVRKDRNEEEAIIGFVAFIMAIVFFLFGCLVLAFYFSPSIILRASHLPAEVELAKRLFLAFLLTLPITLAHRLIQVIFNIRLEDYKYQRIYSLLNFLKIGFAYFLFTNQRYNIVSYYVLTQLLTLLSVFVGVYIAKRDYKYQFRHIFSGLKFNRVIFDKTKALAYGSLFVTISWVLYYELDSLIIGKFVGIKEVAVFNIGFALMTFARSLYGVLYNPMSAKFNHHIGLGQAEELDHNFKRIIQFGIPIAVIPTLILVLTMKQFIFSWVGGMYWQAVLLSKFMYSCYFFAFITYPAGIAMMAKHRIKDLYVLSAILPAIYWVGIVFTYRHLGIQSFGIFKLISFLASAYIYFRFSEKHMAVNWLKILKNNGLALLSLLVFILVAIYYVKPLMPVYKSKYSLLYYILYFVSILIPAFFIYVSFAKDLKKEIFQVVAKFFR